MNQNKENMLRIEQVNILCRRTPVVVIGSLFAAGISVYVLKEWYPLSSLLYWFAAFTVLSCIRLISNWHFMSVPTTMEIVNKRAVVLTIFSAISGCLWGLMGYVFVNISTPIASVLIVMLLTGLVASAVGYLSVLLTACIAFIIPAFSPAAYKFAAFGDDVFSTIAIMIVLFMIASLFIAIDHFRTVRNSILLRFENLDLITDLSQEKIRADKARIAAETSDLAKSKFLAAASHDLRQPMHALKLFTNELDERTRASEYHNIVTRIGLSVDALESLFNAILDISKLDAGTVAVDIKHFRLQQVLNRLSNDYKGRADEKGLTLRFDPSPAIVKTDPTLLERILRNLISNALNYTDAGEITISTAETDNRLIISVHDTGPGIDIADQERIFEEFTQLHNPQRDRSKGLGLGLSIVKRLALLLELPLQLDSAKGRGSMFSVTVPVGDVNEIPVAPVNVNSSNDCSSLFILFIEDEPTVREGMSGLLTRWQCQLLVAESAEDAIMKLNDSELVPDVILSDYRLPGDKTGIDAIQAIRARYGLPIPALIITGDTAPERLHEAHASGIPLLHKPFESMQLQSFLVGVKKEIDIAVEH